LLNKKTKMPYINKLKNPIVVDPMHFKKLNSNSTHGLINSFVFGRMFLAN